MKKVIILAMSALLMGCFVSCNEKKNADNAFRSPLTDSISTLMGDLYGNGLNGQISQDSTLKKADVIRGMEAVLRADTSNHAYITGMQMGMNMLQMFNGIRQQYGIALDQQQFLQHFKDAFLQDSASEEAVRELQQQIEPMMRRAAKEAKENDPKAIENKKAGEAFIQKKAAEQGYQKTESGLVYKVITEGAGDNFVDTDVVMVRYTGKHIDGTEFDASKEEAVPFRLNQVVPGFAEMIKMMKPGEKVEVIIPGDLAYGSEGSGPIGPNETLIFEIETVESQKADAAK